MGTRLSNVYLRRVSKDRDGVVDSENAGSGKDNHMHDTARPAVLCANQTDRALEDGGVSKAF